MPGEVRGETPADLINLYGVDETPSRLYTNVGTGIKGEAGRKDQRTGDKTEVTMRM